MAYDEIEPLIESPPWPYPLQVGNGVYVLVCEEDEEEEE